MEIGETVDVGRDINVSRDLQVVRSGETASSSYLGCRFFNTARNFCTGLKQTFWDEIGQLPSWTAKVSAAYFRGGILLGHFGEGWYAMQAFTQRFFNIAKYKALDIPLKLVFALIVMIIEGNTEARSAVKLGQARHSAATHQSWHDYLRPMELIQIVSGILHSLSNVLGLSELISELAQLSEDDETYKLVIFVVSTLLVLPPATRGFYSLVNVDYTQLAQEGADLLDNGGDEKVVSHVQQPLIVNDEEAHTDGTILKR
ncbi:MAG: hypothetical protein V3V61_06510 [Gammaproteobacteria bacterium]